MITNLTKKERNQIKAYNKPIHQIDKIMVKNGHAYVLYLDSNQYEESDYMIESILEELN